MSTPVAMLEELQGVVIELVEEVCGDVVPSTFHQDSEILDELLPVSALVVMLPDLSDSVMYAREEL